MIGLSGRQLARTEALGSGSPDRALRPLNALIYTAQAMPEELLLHNLGLTVAAYAFAYGAYIVIRTLIMGDPVAGFPTVIVTVLFLGGVQLIVLGLLGEYIGRVFNEMKRRPLYLTESVTWSDIGVKSKKARRGAYRYRPLRG